MHCDTREGNSVRRRRALREAVVGALVLAFAGCDKVGHCTNIGNKYTDLNRGDRCPLMLGQEGTITNSAPLLRLLPAQGDVASAAELMISGTIDGSVADGYGVELRIRGAFNRDEPADPEADGRCTEAFELTPASELDVCTSTSPSVLRCVFDAVGQLGVTVSTLSPEPISGCSVVVRSGEDPKTLTEATMKRLKSEVTQLEVSYPLDTLTLAARLPAKLGACGEQATPCVVPTVMAQATCQAQPSCDAESRGLPLYFATERGGAQIASQSDRTVSLKVIPQTSSGSELMFATDCGAQDPKPVSSLEILGVTGESATVQACVGGLGGLYELRGTVSDGGVVLADSVFVDFPAAPPSVDYAWKDETGTFDVSVLDCDKGGLGGVELGIDFVLSDASSKSVIATTDGAGRAVVPLAEAPLSATVKLGAWDTTCVYKAK